MLLMEYELWLGKFEKDDFIWSLVKRFDNYGDGYKYYKQFVQEQIDLNNDELVEEHESTRLDIELRTDSKKINWVGIYARKNINE